MTEQTVHIDDDAAMQQLGATMAQQLKPGQILGLSGDLGAGKTTFCRGFLKQRGISDEIKSPTFSIVETYHHSQIQYHHVDLYRIEDEEELLQMGFHDYFTADAIVLIEWPEHAPRLLSRLDYHLHIQAADPDTARTVTWSHALA